MQGPRFRVFSVNGESIRARSLGAVTYTSRAERRTEISYEDPHCKQFDTYYGVILK
jgi:hypothetical protein